MPITTEKYAETTFVDSKIDVFSDVFRSMRICGSIVLRESYAPPWAVAIPSADGLRALLKLRNRVRVVAFHFVQRGHIEITPESGERIIVETGEIALCFGGSAHRLSQGSRTKAVPVETLLTSGENPFQPEPEQRTRSTSLRNHLSESAWSATYCRPARR